jgi:hypothetical protein
MATQTATIRITRATRDRLVEREIEAIWESERQATYADAQSSTALEEARLWETTLEDGID